MLSFSGIGHLHPLMSLSRELVCRGHQVTFFDRPKAEARVREAGFAFVPIGAETASVKTPVGPHAVWREVSAIRASIARMRREIERLFEETPAAVSKAGVDVLLIDEIVLTGPTVAQVLQLPYIVVSTSVPHRFGWRCSFWFSGYRYSASWLSWLQSLLLESSVTRMRGPVRRAVDAYRRRGCLGSSRTIWREFPCLAQIGQMPGWLDLPRRRMPSDFHYAGPFLWRAERPHVDFPWHRLDGKPVVYASLGTTRNVQNAILQMIAEACRDLDLQLVISLGDRFESAALRGLPGRPIVTKFAPQLDLVKVARMIITHGGSNTVFEALMEGKPLIVIPMAYDQPAMAARLARLHVAEVLPVMRLSPRHIRAAVIKILNDPNYHDAARKIQVAMQSIRGEVIAADLIEKALEQQNAGRETVMERDGARSKIQSGPECAGLT